MTMKIETRKHLERSQPKAREKYGLLEKHKDYVLRARDYHKKQAQIKILREKARFRNEDEFYHAMINSKTKNGLHVVKRIEQFDGDLLKLLKSQDLKYIQYHRDLNRKKIEAIKEELKALGMVPPDMSVGTESSHVRFVTTVDEVEQIQLKDDVPRLNEAQVTDNKRIRKLLRQLELRFVREETLNKAEGELVIQKKLMTSSGRRYKVGTDERGNAIYKWRGERLK